MKAVLLALALTLILCTSTTLGDCPTFCTLEYQPICGKKSDGSEVTYGNRCQFDYAICEDSGTEYVKDGEC
ncbi:hypothetical protein Trydic_g12838 [Trypoxylus dichotomus]